MPSTPQYLSARRGAEVLAEAQRLVLVGGSEPYPVYTRRAAAQPLEPHLEGDLAVIDQERYLARPHLHDDLGAEDAPVTVPEARVEKPGVVRADLPGARVIDDHLGRVVGG